MESEHIELNVFQQDLIGERVSLDITSAPLSRENTTISHRTSNSSHYLQTSRQTRTRSQNDTEEISSPEWVPGETINEEKQEWSAAANTTYKAYSQYSRTIARHSDFLVFRRFGPLSARVLLFFQKDLMDLESKLLGQDIICDGQETQFLFEAEDEKRNEIIWKICRELKEYYSLANQVAEITRRPNALPEHISSLEIDGSQYLNPNDLKYLRKRLDLFALVPKFRSPIRKVFDKYDFIQWRFWHVRPKKPADVESQSGGIEKIEIDDRFVDRIIKLITITIGLLMLIGPVWILEFVNNPIWKLGVISSFVVLFTVMLAYGTVEKPGNSLIAAAAYAAVLMVFLQLGSS